MNANARNTRYELRAGDVVSARLSTEDNFRPAEIISTLNNRIRIQWVGELWGQVWIVPAETTRFIR